MKMMRTDMRGRGRLGCGILQRPAWSLGVLLIVAACERGGTAAPTLTGSCAIGEPAAIAQAQAGPQDDGTHVLLNGRRIKPAGTIVTVGTFPIGADLSPTGILAVATAGLEDQSLPARASARTTEVTKDWQSVEFVDTTSGVTRFVLPVRSSFVGVRWHPSGTTLYVAGGGRDVVRVIRWYGTSGTAVEVAQWPIFGYPTGLAISRDGQRLYVTLLHRHAVAILDTRDGHELGRFTVRAAPYQVELASDERRAYVSNWSDDTLTVVDLATHTAVTHIVVGKNPEGIAVSADGGTVWVAASDEDRIAEIDTATLSVRRFLDARFAPEDPEGVSPTDVRLAPDGRRLYVVAANENAVLVYDTATGALVGAVPTAMYPTEVEPDSDGRRLYVVSAKGFGAGPNPDDAFVGGIIRGTVQLVELPDAAGLAAWGEDVRRYNDVMASVYDPACQDVRHPVPVQFGKPSPVIEHVIYIMRENKTYDALLGDLGPEADGDPNLVVFGEETTPNLHALARRFANLTNFYSESEQSVQGHIWGANGWVNDFSEKTWIAMWGRPGEAQVILPGMEPASAPKRGDLFQHFLRHGVSVRNYGEYLAVVLDARGATTGITSWKYPSNFAIDDRKKAVEVIRDIEQGKLARFNFIALGNDHTYGLTPGRPTPEYMVADNDEATGRIIEALSRSPYWLNTVVFIFEDDPQGNPDHVDAHRSICIVVSPWVKRGAISRVAYSNPSIHKTAQLILGVPPFSRHVVVAAAMYDIFATEPVNAEPFTAIPSRIPYAVNPPIAELAERDPELAELARRSAAMDFSQPDMAPELGEVLWRYRKRGVSYPAHLALTDQAGENDDDL